MINPIQFVCFFICTSVVSFAQKGDAKPYIINGNESYNHGDFAKAETQYKIALNEDPGSIKGNYNLGNALYKQKKYDESRAHFDRVLHNVKSSKEDKQKAFHNIGKSYFDQNNYEQAVLNFKEALKLNPHDDETRYNYALARKQLEKQKEDRDQNQQKQEQNKEKGDSGQDQQNQDEDQNTNSQEKQKDKGEQGENKQEQKPQNNNGNQAGGQNGNNDGEGDSPQNQQISKGSDGKGQESPQALNPEYQEGLLNALQKQEQETLKKIISQKAQKVRVNTEKDW